MDHVRQAQRIITSHMRRSPQRFLAERDPGVRRGDGPTKRGSQPERAVEVLTLAIQIEGRSGFVSATEMPGAAEPWTFYWQGEAGAREQEAQALAALAAMDRLPPDVPIGINTPNMNMAVALTGRTADNRLRTPGLARLVEMVTARAARTDWQRMGQA